MKEWRGHLGELGFQAVGRFDQTSHSHIRLREPYSEDRRAYRFPRAGTLDGCGLPDVGPGSSARAGKLSAVSRGTGGGYTLGLALRRRQRQVLSLSVGSAWSTE